MELDDMKEKWQHAEKDTKEINVGKMIQKKSMGPMAALKAAFRKQMIAMTVVPLTLVLTNLNDLHAVVTSILFWCYVAVCVSMISYAGYNYYIVRRMEMMTEQVRLNIERLVRLLEKRKQWELISLRVTLLTFIVLFETVPYIQHYRMLDRWHGLPVIIRIVGYVSLLALQYVLNRTVSERRSRRHIRTLKKIVAEMQG